MADYLSRGSLNSSKKTFFGFFSLVWSRKVDYLRYHYPCPPITVSIPLWYDNIYEKCEDQKDTLSYPP